jgi:hypothetical protein
VLQLRSFSLSRETRRSGESDRPATGMMQARGGRPGEEIIK